MCACARARARPRVVRDRSAVGCCACVRARARPRPRVVRDRSAVGCCARCARVRARDGRAAPGAAACAIDQSITELGRTMWRWKPSSFGSRPSAKPTSCGRWSTGIASLRPTSRSASGCCRSRFRWHSGHGVTRQSACASTASPRWRAACFSDARLCIVMIGKPQHFRIPAYSITVPPNASITMCRYSSRGCSESIPRRGRGRTM